MPVDKLPFQGEIAKTSSRTKTFTTSVDIKWWKRFVTCLKYNQETLVEKSLVSVFREAASHRHKTTQMMFFLFKFNECTKPGSL